MIIPRLLPLAAIAVAAAATPSLAANMISPDIDVTTKTVTVAAVSADRPGYVVVHDATARGAAGTVMGYAPIAAGTTENVSINLDESGASVGRPIVIVLHEEIDGDGEFGTGDRAVAVGDELVQQIVTVK